MMNMGNCLKKMIQQQRITGTHYNFKLECKFERHISYYSVDCLPNSQGMYQCSKLQQMSNLLNFCCDMKCD